MSDRLDERLSDALAEIEPVEASPGFTRRVLSRIDERPDRVRRTRLRLAGAGAALLLAAGAGLWRSGSLEAPANEDLSHRAQRLRAETRLLEAELAELRRQADESLATLELASGEDLDLVLDLRPLVRGRGYQPDRPAAAVEAVERR